MSLNINKNGLITTELFTEFIANTFDTNFYVEPDGSMWIRIFHHNNPANARFAQTDTFTSQVYKDADRWFNVKLCDLLSGSWELMVKQKTTSDATEAKYRWIQSTTPMGGSYDATVVANVTKITTSGYSVNTNAGGAYVHNSNTYIVINNSSNGNWFGAIGSWNAHQGGIPGYPNTVISTGYMDLYLRIDSAKANLNQVKFGNNYIQNREIIEV